LQAAIGQLAPKTGAGERAVRYAGATWQVDGVSVRRRARDAGTGRNAGPGNAADPDRVHCEIGVLSRAEIDTIMEGCVEDA